MRRQPCSPEGAIDYTGATKTPACQVLTVTPKRLAGNTLLHPPLKNHQLDFDYVTFADFRFAR